MLASREPPADQGPQGPGNEVNQGWQQAHQAYAEPYQRMPKHNYKNSLTFWARVRVMPGTAGIFHGELRLLGVKMGPQLLLWDKTARLPEYGPQGSCVLLGMEGDGKGFPTPSRARST